MSTVALTGKYTLMDIMNAYSSADGGAQYVWAAEILSRTCPFFQKMPMLPSNQIMSAIGSRRSYLPTPSTRGFNQGSTPTASHRTPFSEPIAMMEDWSMVDYKEWQIQNDPNQWRQDEDAAKLEAMTQKAEDMIIYGNRATDPNGIDGLITRFNTTTHRPNDDSTWPYNVISCGGSDSAATASVLIVSWGPRKVHGIYPKNLRAGIEIDDKDMQTVNLGTGTAQSLMDALITKFGLCFGILVYDERCVQRLCDINVSGTSNIFDHTKLITALNQLPSGSDASNTDIFVPRAIKTQIDILACDKNNALYMAAPGDNDVFGRPITRFRGVPIWQAEMMDETETAI